MGDLGRTKLDESNLMPIDTLIDLNNLQAMIGTI